RDDAHLRPSLLESGARSEPAENRPEPRNTLHARVLPSWTNTGGRPELELLRWELEIVLHDPDDLEVQATHIQRLTDYVRGGMESTLPKPITQHNHPVAVYELLVSNRASQNWRAAQQGKEISGDPGVAGPLRFRCRPARLHQGAVHLTVSRHLF